MAISYMDDLWRARLKRTLARRESLVEEQKRMLAERMLQDRAGRLGVGCERGVELRLVDGGRESGAE